MSSSRKYHVSPYKPVPVRPSAGGKLMSNVSADSAGIYNYTVKRDFRRVLDHERRSEGHDFFWANTSIPLGNQPYPNSPDTDEPITLLVMARQPNGRTAIVAATPTTIFRYFALDNGDYYTGNGTAGAYYLESGGNTPYFNNNPGIWLVIGSGFSPQAQRWEWVNLNGYLVLNNGVDLPVTYRVEEYAVKPIYELRENGIACVGNISQSNGLLLCADVSEIDGDALTKLMSLISSGAVTASQAGCAGPTLYTASLAAGTVTAAQNTFSMGSVGKTIRFVNGQSFTITAYTSATVVSVADVVTAVSNLAFFLCNPGTTDYTVTASAPIFDNTMVGRQIVWPDGTVRVITAYTDTTHVVVDSNLPVASSNFGLNNPAAYAPYTDGSTINRIQYRIIWGMTDLPRRWSASAPASIASGSVSLKFEYPVKSFQELVGQQITILGAGVNGGNLMTTLLFLGADNMTAIIDTPASTQSNLIPLDATYNLPDNFPPFHYVQIPVVQGSTYQYGQGNSAYIVNAGPTGGLIFTSGQFVAASSVVYILGSPGPVTATLTGAVYSGVLVEAFDATGALTGFTDLQDDGSGIIAMDELLGYVVVYKDTAIFIGQYTGTVGDAFNFDGNNKYAGSKTLYYRHTLVSVNANGQQFHLYAGRNSFYRFDLVTREPVEVETGELCKNLFFENASLPGTTGPNLVPPGSTYFSTPPFTQFQVGVVAGGTYYFTHGNATSLQNGTALITASGQFTAQSNVVTLTGPASAGVTAMLATINNIGVFAADNEITKEVFFCFPNAAGPDKALRYDYFGGTVSSTSAAVTAAATIKRPVAGIQIGPTEDWFIMGLPDGTVVRYGYSDTMPLKSGSVTLTQSGNTVTSSLPFFTPDLVIGRSIQFPDLSVVSVTAYASPTQITVGGPAVTRAATPFTLLSAIWHRLGQPYDSVLQSGLEAFGSSFGEKDIEAELVNLASDSPGSTLLLEILGAPNPTPAPGVLGSKSITSPLTRNAVGMLFRQNYLADRITVSGINNPLEIIQRVFNIAGVDSKAFILR